MASAMLLLANMNDKDAKELPNPPDATVLPNPPAPSAPRPVMTDTDGYASFDPPANWNPLVENHLGTDVPADKLDEFLKIAYKAKLGRKYSEERPIEVSSGKVVVVRFPDNTNATPGFRRRGPNWAATVTIDAETMRVLSVLEDAN